MYTVIYNITLDPIKSEQILENAFLTLWKEKFNLDLKKKTLFSWSISIARKEALKGMGEDPLLQQEPVLIDSHSSFSNPIHANYSKVLNLILLHGNTADQASQIMRVPMSTIKTRCRLAISALRNKIDKETGKFKGLPSSPDIFN